jgi:hypothetical protein
LAWRRSIEVLADNTTLKDFLARIERQYGKARRTWLMDRDIPRLLPAGDPRSPTQAR